MQTCDTNGAVSSSELCALGCFDNEPRCRELDPSNGLAAYVDMVTAPPDIDLVSSGSIDTGTGTLMTNSMTIQVPNFLMPAPANAPAVRVFIVHDFHIAANNLVYALDSTSTDQFTGIALAIVATGTITIDGELDALGAPGSHADPACNGHNGQETDNGARQQTAASGGGGFATPGANGGNVVNGLGGGAGGGTTGNAALVPLRGGCPAGAMVTDNGQYSTFGTAGGGAIQLSAGVALVINGTMNVDGGTGYPEQVSIIGSGVYGGGSGGGILLEGPNVTLGPQAKLLARGGAGGSTAAPSSYPVDGNPLPGVPCGTPSVYCGGGGDGAAAGIDAKPGKDAQYTNSSSVIYMTSGGGGGGLGRIRINTASGTYTKSSGTIEAGALTTGTVGTR